MTKIKFIRASQSTAKRSIATAFLALIGATSALAQAPPPPPPPPPAPALAVDSNDNRCGWVLGGVGAALGAGILLAPPTAASNRWTGFYAGAQAGCAWGDTAWQFQNSSAFSAGGGTTGLSNDGWVAGGQIGYNQQLGQWVVGAEATWSKSDMHDQRINPLTLSPTVNTSRLTTDVDSIVTVVARLGFLLDPRWMAYVKGGYASAEVDTSIFIASNVTTSASASSSTRHHGWTLGAGLEYLLAPNIVLGADYGFISLEDKTHALSCGGSFACTPSPVVNVSPDSIHVLTGRVSFKFGG